MCVEREENALYFRHMNNVWTGLGGGFDRDDSTDRHAGDGRTAPRLDGPTCRTYGISIVTTRLIGRQTTGARRLDSTDRHAEHTGFQ